MNPEKIGRYEIKSELGRGGMATVYRAYDPRFEREVAVKVLPREMLHDENFRLRFQREAKTIASLEHPAIVPVYDVGEDDGQPYFVMRCMTGGSLAEQIERGPVSLQDSAHIMNRLGPALDEAHAKGIIHRDLKPGNILFDRTGEPYVSDFGIAKIAQGQSTTVTGGAIIGTPAYMSPEQAQGEPLDGRSDIYALGVIIYEMLAGSQPYQATTPMAVVVKHITDPIPHILDVNPRLPSGIEVIIEKAMAKNPDQRFATAGEFAAALSALASGESVEQALKTATLSVTRVQANKTRMAGKVDVTRAKGAPQAAKAGISPLVFVIPIVGVIGIGILLVGAYFLLNGGLAAGQQPTATLQVVIPAVTETFPAGEPTATQAAIPVEEPTPTETPPPAVNAIGGADSVAFIANNDIWLMNMDGSNLQQLTSDGASKTELQWMPDGETLVFISGKNINTVNSKTSRFDTILTFPFSEYLDDFQISPDGKQVAISLNRQMFIVPFDLDTLKDVHGRDALIAMEPCLYHTAHTPAAAVLKEFRWSDDDPKLISWLFQGVGGNSQPADLVSVVDISTCDPTKIDVLDSFPGTRFSPTGYGSNPIIPDFDWDGQFLFLLNSYIRNNGWGFLYAYNYDVRKANQLDVFPGKCCYRDARFSPDGTYVFFAFQDQAAGDKATTEFYYVSYGAIGTGTQYTPIPMPEGLFKNQREAPQPALHSAAQP